MAKILIPRSDSISAKVIAPSDFEAFFSQDLVNNYVKSGFTLTAGSGLAVNIAVGVARLKGFYISNSTSSSKGSLTASNTNHIYITLARDSFSEAESWDFTSNTTGVAAADSLFIGTATTDGSSVTAVNMSAVYDKALPSDRYGTGVLGDVTISGDTTLSASDNIRQYANLTVNASTTLTCGTTGAAKKWLFFATEKITINGTINLNGMGAAGGSGGSGGGGGARVVTSVGNAGSAGGAGGTGGAGYNQASATGGTNAAAGAGGAASNLVANHAGGSGGAAGNSGGTPSTIIDTTADENYELIILAFDQLSHWGAGGNGGTGGGGGGSGGSHGSWSGAGGAGGGGGAGGAGGGSIILCAPIIQFGASASITCSGLAGSNGSAGGTGGGNDGGSSGGGAGGAGAIIGGAAAVAGSTGATSNGGAGGGGGGGSYGVSGRDGFVSIIGHSIPSQSDLNARSTAYKKLRLEW